MRRRMPLKLRAKLAQRRAVLVQIHVSRVSEQTINQRVDVSVRKENIIALVPARIRRIVPQFVKIERHRLVARAHRPAGVTGAGSGRSDQHVAPNFGGFFLQSFNIGLPH